MRSTVIWSFLSVVALSAGGLLSGCDSDATITKSGIGESCDSSADCGDDLKCLQGACYKVTPPSDGDAGADGVGGTTSGPPEPVLGNEGESCTRRADCKEGLGCFNQRCVATPSGEGGEGNIPGGPVLGKNGETCQTSADCETGLGCLPGGYIGAPGQPIGFVGVCSTPSGTLTPSGKSCTAECVKDTDCCELPVALHVPWAAIPGLAGEQPYGTGANSCSELAAAIGSQKCATAVANTALAAQCFAQAAYCQCDDTWTCDAGKCNYVADCSASGPNVGGCPNFSRSGLPTTADCNADTNKCEPVKKPVCATDADCGDNAIVLADSTGEKCGVDECVCYEKRGCYRACNGPLDCAPGYTCDDDSSVCKPVPACTSNAQCVGRKGARYACIDDVCQIACTSDYECYLGVLSGPATKICSAKGICEMIGCVDDDECTNGAANPVKMFCVADPEPVVGIRSAITD